MQSGAHINIHQYAEYLLLHSYDKDVTYQAFRLHIKSLCKVLLGLKGNY